MVDSVVIVIVCRMVCVCIVCVGLLLVVFMLCGVEFSSLNMVWVISWVLVLVRFGFSLCSILI